MAGVKPTTSIPAEFLDSAQLRKAREFSIRTREELDALLTSEVGKYASEDTSLVVFGSLARGEWTTGSDLDWTYLIDGEAKPEHLVIAQKIQKALKKNEKKFRSPGQTGTFGNLAFSHDIIHQIGGPNDTNKNTTQRILLLLESLSIGRRKEAYDRVIKGVIDRYLEEDNNHLLTRDSKAFRVPRFLLNEISCVLENHGRRFCQQTTRSGWRRLGLRNAKLRMSRKAHFSSGQAGFRFSANLDSDFTKVRFPPDKNGIKLKLLQHIWERVGLTPLEIVAGSVERYGIPDLRNQGVVRFILRVPRNT